MCYLIIISLGLNRKLKNLRTALTFIYSPFLIRVESYPFSTADNTSKFKVQQ